MAQRVEHSGTVLAWVLPHLVAYVGGLGLPTARLRHVLGLRERDLRDPDARVPDRAAAEAWRVAFEITNDSALGLHMAQAIPRGALDLLEYAFRSSPTLQAGLERLARYGRVISDRAAATLVHEGDALVILWQGGVERSRADFALAFVLRMAREATGRPIAPVDVRVAHPEPARLAEYREFFRAPIRFNAPANQLRLQRADLAAPLVSADAALSRILSRRLEKMVRQLPRRDESTVARVRREVIEGLAPGRASSKAVSRTLGLSERTLSRRLHASGTSFRRILDDVRRDLAMSLLADRAAGTAEIAFVLGYSEAAAFHRSFRRWTGQTPDTFRRTSHR
jgi:AraC-like DNA-binding protein